MLESIQMRFYQVLETWKTDGFAAVRRESFYAGREAILTVKELNRQKPPRVPLDATGLKCMELSGLPSAYQNLKYSLKSRQVKMIRNLNKGYQAFAFVGGNEVIGDVWHCTGGRGKKPAHPDMKWLGIEELKENEAYMFDFYIRPDKRKGGLINTALGHALNTLKDKGFERVYGFYMADNLPALWMHRTTGYSEINRVRIKRHLFGIHPVRTIGA